MRALIFAAMASLSLVGSGAAMTVTSAELDANTGIIDAVRTTQEFKDAGLQIADDGSDWTIMVNGSLIENTSYTLNSLGGDQDVSRIEILPAEQGSDGSRGVINVVIQTP